MGKSIYKPVEITPEYKQKVMQRFQDKKDLGVMTEGQEKAIKEAIDNGEWSRANRMLNTATTNRGRPKGSKARSKLLAEALKYKFEARMRRDFKRVLDVVVEEAVENRNMKAAKLILDMVKPYLGNADPFSIDADKGTSGTGVTVVVNAIPDTRPNLGEVIDGTVIKVKEIEQDGD